MLGPLSFVASYIAAVVRRMALGYGLMAGAGLLLFCAAAYALDAAHSGLTVRYGPITASLAIAGSLLVVAGICLVIAAIVRRNAIQRSTQPSGVVGAQPLRYVSPSRIKAMAAGAAGAASALLAIWGLRRSRGA